MLTVFIVKFTCTFFDLFLVFFLSVFLCNRYGMDLMEYNVHGPYHLTALSICIRRKRRQKYSLKWLCHVLLFSVRLEKSIGKSNRLPELTDWRHIKMLTKQSSNPDLPIDFPPISKFFLIIRNISCCSLKLFIKRTALS